MYNFPSANPTCLSQQRRRTLHMLATPTICMHNSGTWRQQQQQRYINDNKERYKNKIATTIVALTLTALCFDLFTFRCCYLPAICATAVFVIDNCAQR